MTAELVTLAEPASERQYLFHRPSNSTNAVPLVIVLHGTGGTAAWADDETGWSAFADREGFALALPDAIPPYITKPPKFLTNPQRWNDGSPSVGQFPSSEADDVGFLTAVIHDAIARGSVDPNRVYVTGFSNGAGMTFRFAAERAELLAAIAPVAGHSWLPEPKLARPVPTLYLIGTADPLVPIEGGSVRSPWGARVVRPRVMNTLRSWATAIGCDGDPVTANAGEVVFPAKPGGVEFRAQFIKGLGHHWPGGKGQLDERFGGPPSSRVNGNEAVWAFLRRHRR